MNDQTALNFLKKRLGGDGAVAALFGLESKQAVSNWRRRGIPPASRPAVWLALNQRGANLPKAWLTRRRTPKKKGNGHGGTRARKANGKEERRAAA